MIEHPEHYVEKLYPGDARAVLDAALHILAVRGLTIQSPRARDALHDCGAKVIPAEHRVIFPEHLVLDKIKTAPAQWTLHARDPKRSVRIGGPALALCPGYGSAFIADTQGARRSATLHDFENFARLAGASEQVDITGGLLVEPNDLPLPYRPLEITHALIRNSDKPFMGSVAGRSGALESLEMAKILFGDLREKPCVLGLININSPLRLDQSMADALLAYIEHRQPVLLTPGILMGITAPVTLIGAMAQAFAELLAGVVLVQTLEPGCPVIIGLGGFGSDMRNGGTGFGRPENAVATLLGAQLARLVNLPFRCSGGVTGSRRPDCRSGYERMMTALSAYQSGTHFCLQALGILDSINMMSYEQFIIDLEIWSYIKQLSRKFTVDTERLALNVLDEAQDGFLSHEHTVRHMRTELHVPDLAGADSYEHWWLNNRMDTVAQAAKIARERLADIQPPPMDDSLEKELNRYVHKRRQNLASMRF